MTQVWKTLRGGRYHASPDCPGITDGHAEASSRGYPNHEPRPLDLSQMDGSIKPCLRCWGPMFEADRWLRTRLEAEIHADSPYELTFLTSVLRRVQPPIDPDYLRVQEEATGRSGRRYRVDYAVIRPNATPIAIEIDGFQKDKLANESDEGRQSSMSTRQNDLVNNGWQVLRFTNRQVTADPGACRTDLERALAPRRTVPEGTQIGLSGGGESGASRVRGSVLTVPGSDGAEPDRRHRGLAVAALVVVLAGIAGAVVWVGGDDGSVRPDSIGGCPPDHPIKGNDTGDDRIYHVLGWRYYDSTMAEKCFSTASDAEDAGYRASQVQ